jgi:hypothetical protein
LLVPIEFTTPLLQFWNIFFPPVTARRHDGRRRPFRASSLECDGDVRLLSSGSDRRGNCKVPRGTGLSYGVVVRGTFVLLLLEKILQGLFLSVTVFQQQQDEIHRQAVLNRAAIKFGACEGMYVAAQRDTTGVVHRFYLRVHDS